MNHTLWLGAGLTVAAGLAAAAFRPWGKLADWWQRRANSHRSRCQCRRCRRKPPFQGDPPWRPEPRRGRPDGSHEACALTVNEYGWSQFFARRYPSLGKGVLR